MQSDKSSSYLEVYQDADGDAVVEVYVSPEDIKAAAGDKVAIPVSDEDRDLGVSEVHVSQTVSPDKVRKASRSAK
jgi:hypothetical protein